MEILTQKINKFKKDRCIKIYSEILPLLFDEYESCVICSGPIFYYDSFIKERKMDVGGKSFKSFKVVNGSEYKLSVCENCLTKKYPDYQDKNKSRVFNQMNKYSRFAYMIDDLDYNIQRDSYILNTKESMISKYGDIEGNDRWESYINKQAYTNTLEYKSEKYGWSEEDFNEYNNSRSVTIDNLISRHGEDVGVEKWNKYVDRQRETKSKSYYVNKYGIDKWEELCESKAHTFSNYIKWYGSEEKALEMIQERHKIWNSVSKSSQRYLSGFDEYLKSKYDVNTYYDELNKEYMIITEDRDIYYLDYFIKEWNIGIEYNGDLFHANPCMYSEDDTPIPYSELTSREIWDRDKRKKETIESERNMIIIYIWESDLPEYEKLVEIIDERRI